jgi:hypothetical protein
MGYYKRDDLEYLKAILGNPKWWHSGDAVHTVASILEYYGYLNTARETIDYFEKPWQRESDIQTLVEELNEEVNNAR